MIPIRYSCTDGLTRVDALVRSEQSSSSTSDFMFSSLISTAPSEIRRRAQMRSLLRSLPVCSGYTDDTLAATPETPTSATPHNPKP